MSHFNILVAVDENWGIGRRTSNDDNTDDHDSDNDDITGGGNNVETSLVDLSELATTGRLFDKLFGRKKSAFEDDVKIIENSGDSNDLEIPAPRSQHSPTLADRCQHSPTARQHSPTNLKLKLDDVVPARHIMPWANTPVGTIDMQYFRRQTRSISIAGGLTSTLIMGANTWRECGQSLRGRMIIIVSSSITNDDIPTELAHTTKIRANFDDAYNAAVVVGLPIWVIGGAQVYTTALAHYALRHVYVSRIPDDHKCDVFFPKHMLTGLSLTTGYYHHNIQPPTFVPHVDEHMYDVLTDADHRQSVVLLREPMQPTALQVDIYSTVTAEYEYLNIMRKLLRTRQQANRTGVPAMTLTAETLRFPLMDARGKIWPLLTSKKMAWKSIFYELIWFLRGDSDLSFLHQHGVKIWDANTTAAYLKNIGSDLSVGTVGKAYGYQWRHWQGRHDQLAAVVKALREQPLSRRHVVTAWNPLDLSGVALPPCHMMFQFISDGEHLSTVVTMRSGDWFLGIPFNVASYAMLTHIVALIVGLEPSEVILNIADAHLYRTHVDAAKLQLLNRARRLPVFTFVDLPDGKKFGLESAARMTADNIMLTYDDRHHAQTIKAPMC